MSKAIILTAILCISGTVLAETYGGGSGTAVDPYLIYTGAHLDLLGQTPADWGSNIYFRQMDHISLSSFTGTQFHRIGNASDSRFYGVYDGNNYTINSFTYTDSTADYVGLFGYTASTSIIKNVRMVNVNVTGHDYVAAVAGNSNGIIQNCSVEGGTITGNQYVGGLAGYAFFSISDCSVNATVSGVRTVGGIAGQFKSSGNAVDNCRTQGSVSGGNGSTADVGGIVGRLYTGTVRRCTSTAAINATGDNAGGIVGSTYLSTLIEKSSAAGNVSSTYSYVGGIVGELYFSSIIFCRTSGAVQGLDSVGGIAGKAIGNPSQITDCVATGDVSGNGRVGGILGWLVVNSGTVTLTRCGADNFNVTTQAAYGGGLVGEIQANSPGTVVISQCFAYPDITANGSTNSTRSYQAGLAGSALRTTFLNCSAWGSVYNAYQYSGGLVGSMANCTVTNCYSTGNPSGAGDVGGLIGKATTCTITNSFWDQWTSGEPTGSWGTPKTTTEMRLRSTFTGWDFVGESTNGTEDIWRMCVDGITYPKLTWWFKQNGDFACPDIVAMEDFAYLAARWMRTDCVTTGNCEGADLNRSGDVEINDLITFADNWLEGV